MVHKAIQHHKAIYDTAFPFVFKTITSDNGSEFSELSQAFGVEQVKVYYTHLYICERGPNERYNGLIRRFIPKGQSIDELNYTLITYVENWCNTLPRKILGYHSSNDRYEQEMINVA